MTKATEPCPIDIKEFIELHHLLGETPFNILTMVTQLLKDTGRTTNRTMFYNTLCWVLEVTGSEDDAYADITIPEKTEIAFDLLDTLDLLR